MTARVVLLSEINSKFGAPFLLRLHACPDVEVIGLVTTAPGRVCDYYVGEDQPVDLAQLAHHVYVPVYRPVNVNAPDLVSLLGQQAPDYLVIANYQQILRAELLAVPRVGTINFHPSPLPRYAGLAPFFWMARHGERDGGVSAVWTTAAIDAGPLVGQRPVALTGGETGGQIRDLHFRESLRLLDDLLPALVGRRWTRTAQQDGDRTYFGRPGPGDYDITWADPAEQVLRTIRAACPHPGATTYTTSGRPWRILTAHPSPLAGPPAPVGTVRSLGPDQLYVRAADGWVQVTTVAVRAGAQTIPVDVRDLPAVPDRLLPHAPQVGPLPAAAAS